MNQVKQLIKETKKYLTKYDYEKVIELCDKILEIEPESSFGLEFNGIAHIQSGKYKKALKYYEKLYQIKPTESIKYSIADLNEKIGNYEKALECYDKNSDKKWIQSKRKRLLTNMKCYIRLINEYDEKIEELYNTTENIKEKIALLEEKAVFQYRNNDYEEALKSYKESYRLYQAIKSKQKSYYDKKHEKWYNMLKEHADKNPIATEFFKKFFNYNTLWQDKLKYGFYPYTDSIVYTDLLLELNPDNIGLLKLCASEYGSVDIDYSLDCLYKIIEIEPENTEIIERILQIYRRQYSKDKSLKLINQKLYIEETRSRFLSQKIRLLESMTLYDEAIAAYNEYLSMDVDEFPIYNHLTEFDKIRCIEQKALDNYLENRIEESYNILKEAMEIFRAIKNSDKEISLENNLDEWYEKILIESFRKSNSPKTFFDEYYTINDNTLELWIEKINFLKTHFGNPIDYCNILLKNNKDNTGLLLAKASVHYYHRRWKKALDIYNQVLEIEDNDEAKNFKFNIFVHNYQYIQAYELLKTIKYPVVDYYINKLAKELLKDNRYEESLYVYQTIFEETHNINSINQIKYLYNKLGYDEKLDESPYYMEWIELINYKYESDNCPYCGKDLIPIIFGYPDPEAIKKSEEGEIILGGCCVSEDDPTHYCKYCKKEINMGLYNINITNDDLDLSTYARRKIYWITEYIQENPDNSIKTVKKEAQRIGMNSQEFNKFIEKLEEIKHIKREKNTLKIV